MRTATTVRVYPLARNSPQDYDDLGYRDHQDIVGYKVSEGCIILDRKVGDEPPLPAVVYAPGQWVRFEVVGE